MRFAEPNGTADGSPAANHRDEVPSPPLSESDEKEKDDKVIISFHIEFCAKVKKGHVIIADKH